MKPIHLIAGVSTLVAVATSFAGARSSYSTLALSQLKLEQDPTSIKASCKFCHLSVFGGQGWNKFGTAVKTQFEGAANQKIQDALYLVLKDNKDSDGDGYNDVLEVVAKSLPGDAKSKPSIKVADLEAQLQKLGGVEIFKATSK